MDDMSVEQIISDISGMEIDDPEDTFFENLTELWACIDKLLSVDSEDGFNAHFGNVSDGNWAKIQTNTFARLKVFLQDYKHVLKNKIVLRICNCFSLLQGTINRGNSQHAKETQAKFVKDLTARILLDIQVKKRRRSDDFQDDHAAKSGRLDYDLRAQWQAIDRLATLLSR